MLKVSLFAWFIGPWNPNNRTAETAKGNNIHQRYFGAIKESTFHTVVWKVLFRGNKAVR
jgi:hypothetical protein